MSQIVQTLVLENDIVEILYNPILSQRPYLIRWINYDNQKYEFRVNSNDIQELVSFLQRALEHE